MQESLMKCNTEDTDDGHPCPLHIITYITCKHKKKKNQIGSSLLCCGGPTRTGDLQVMSLASYQLLHPAMFNHVLFFKSDAKVGTFSELSNILSIFLSKNMLYNIF